MLCRRWSRWWWDCSAWQSSMDAGLGPGHRKRRMNMGKVGAGFSMSLDGFIAGPQDDVERLFQWYFSGDTDFQVPSGRMVLKVSPESADSLRTSRNHHTWFRTLKRQANKEEWELIADLSFHESRS